MIHYRTYTKIDEGTYEVARPSTLTLGIFGVLFGGFISIIFLILSYTKLVDILKITHRGSSAPTKALITEKNCVSYGCLVNLNNKFCPSCGAKLPE